MIDTTEMQQLVELIKGSDIRELTLKQGEARVTLRRAPAVAANYTTEPGVADSECVTGQYVDLGSGYVNEAEGSPEPQGVAVIAPRVGYFHHVKPMVGMGARVKAGQVVALIEAMKINTEVVSPIDGTVVDTFVEDGVAVEYGQPLFDIKPGTD